MIVIFQDEMSQEGSWGNVQNKKEKKNKKIKESLRTDIATFMQPNW